MAHWFTELAQLKPLGHKRDFRNTQKNSVSRPKAVGGMSVASFVNLIRESELNKTQVGLTSPLELFLETVE